MAKRKGGSGGSTASATARLDAALESSSRVQEADDGTIIVARTPRTSGERRPRLSQELGILTAERFLVLKQFNGTEEKKTGADILEGIREKGHKMLASALPAVLRPLEELRFIERHEARYATGGRTSVYSLTSDGQDALERTAEFFSLD